jgi:hypothetical protein
MMFDAESACRPPTRSICRPTRGPSNPAITSDAEKAAKNQFEEMPRSRAIGSARMAGRYRYDYSLRRLQEADPIPEWLR